MKGEGGVPISRYGKDIIVTRSDVNEIRLAKGAIRAGFEKSFMKAIFLEY